MENRKNAKKIKKAKIAFIVLLSVVLVLASALIFIFHAPYSFANDGTVSAEYLSLHSGISGISAKNPKINQIAMLGSHDCFSDQITKASGDDPADTSLYSNDFVRAVAGEFIPRYLKTQTIGAGAQLRAGVRYFDVRLSHVGGVWWTKHAVLSGIFEPYLVEIIEFLNAHSGEVVILDFQHVYTGGVDISELLDYLATVSSGGKNIYDYIPYATQSGDNSHIDFADLRYNDVTAGGAESGVVMFFNFANAQEKLWAQQSSYANKVYSRGENVRSLWHQSNSGKYIISEIGKEADMLLTSSEFSDMLRVNQTQHSLVLKAGSVLRNVFGWSLLNLAENHNAKLVAHPDFFKWLAAMPVFMVDFVNSEKGDFNELVNQKICEYNTALVAGA